MLYHDQNTREQYSQHTRPVLKLAALAIALQMAWTPSQAQTETLISYGRDVYASSIRDNNMPQLAVDGTLNTRWESAWGKDPQWLYVDLGAVANVSRVVIDWEGAFAKEYRLQASTDEIHWQDVGTPVTNNNSLTNDIPLNTSTRYLRVYGTKRNNPAYGYSIKELNVYGTSGATASLPPAPNIASGKSVTASSIEKDQSGASKELTEKDYLAANVTDDNGGTRWSSKYGDNEWIQVDLGQSTVIGAVEFDWQAAYGRAYNIQVSEDGTNFKTVYRTLAGPGGNDRVPLYEAGRYVRMQGIGRAGESGYSMYEFKVFPWRQGDAKPAYTTPTLSTPQRVTLGKGSYEQGDVTQVEPPPPTFKTDAIKGPVPSNDWWTSLLLTNFGGGSGLVSLPLRSTYSKNGLGVTTIDAGYLTADGNSVNTQRDTDLYIRPTNLVAGNAVTKVSGYGDYHVNIVFSDDATPKMTSTLVQGSPFVYNTFANPEQVLISAYGLVRLFDKDGNTVLTDDAQLMQGDAVGMEVLSADNGPEHKSTSHFYGLFAPAGSKFLRIGNSLKITLPADQPYLSVGTMQRPGDMPDFYQHAYAFVTGTRADYQVDLATSQVTTTFNTVTTVKRSGFSAETIMGLLPHQWKTSPDARLDGRTYPSVRGDIKMMDGNSFQTVNRFHGLIPNFVEPTNPEYSRAKLAGYFDTLDLDLIREMFVNDPYWQGKKLHPLALAIIAADQVGDAVHRDRYIATLRGIIADWLTYSDGEPLHKRYFHYTPSWGTLVPGHSDFGVNYNLSDHHFTYGYFTFAAGVLANYDKTFAADYGDMVEMLLRDYANPSRTDPLFPQFRNFSPYVGHSWAGGFGDNPSGANQEAAGEALFSWVGQYLWGMATNKPVWRDAGIYGFTTEEKSIEQYWFNYDRDNWLTDWTHGSVGQIYGSANAFTTFFDGRPVYVYGIHWLPPAEWMTYFGREQDKAAALYQSYLSESNGDARDWSNVVWSFEALSNPADVLAKFDASKLPALETSNVYWFANAMASLGHRSNDIWAVGWPAATVYQNAKGYVAQVWNPGDTQRTVQFSNGSGITGSAVVPAHATIQVDPTRTVTVAPVIPAPVDPYLATTGWSASTFTTQGEQVANMLDGAPGTRWSSGQTQKPGQWVQIDLKSLTTFDTLFINAGSTGDYATTQEIYLSADGTSWNKVNESAGAASLVLSLGTQKARYVKIVNTGSSDRWWSITEVKLANFGTPTKPTTPALPAPTGTIDRSSWTVISDTNSGTDVPLHMIDGSRTTSWSNGLPQKPVQWVQVDMGTNRYVDAVTLDAAGRTGDYPRGLRIYVSEDGQNWGDAVYTGGAFTTQRVAATFTPAKGRYLHIEQTGTAPNWWSIAELNAAYNGVGALTEIDPTGWTATASVTGGAEIATYAIDGKTDTRWTTGKTQTAGQWFQVDLGSIQTVKQIDLNTNPTDYPRAYQVQVSQDGQTWSDPVATGTGAESYLSIAIGVQTARYVRITQTGTANVWWSIAEMKLFK
jgi:endo-1,3(4)-beta-glucanase